MKAFRIDDEAILILAIYGVSGEVFDATNTFVYSKAPAQCPERSIKMLLQGIHSTAVPTAIAGYETNFILHFAKII